MLMCSVRSDSAAPGTAACQAPLSMGLSQQEYWSGLPFFLPGDLPRDRTCFSYGFSLIRQILNHRVTWEANYTSINVSHS